MEIGVTVTFIIWEAGKENNCNKTQVVVVVVVFAWGDWVEHKFQDNTPCGAK